MTKSYVSALANQVAKNGIWSEIIMVLLTKSGVLPYAAIINVRTVGLFALLKAIGKEKWTQLKITKKLVKWFFGIKGMKNDSGVIWFDRDEKWQDDNQVLKKYCKSQNCFYAKLKNNDVSKWFEKNRLQE